MDSLTSNEEVIVGKRGQYMHQFGPENTQELTGEDCIENGEVHSAAVFVSEYFTEKPFVLSLVLEIVKDCDSIGEANGLLMLRSRLRKVLEILEKYREDPALLDPHIVEILRPVVDGVLMSAVLRGWSPTASVLCSLVYVVGSICGYKTLLSNEVFPHHFSLLSQVLARMENLDGSWEASYVLFLWLSVLVRIPFDFDSIGIPDLSSRLYEAGVRGASGNLSVCKSASVFLGRFFTRSDRVSEKYFSRFTEGVWAGRLFFLETVCKTVAFAVDMHEGRILELAESILCLPCSSVRETKLRILILASLAAQLARKRSSTHLPIIESCINAAFAAADSKDGSVRNAVAKSLSRISAALPAGYRSQLVHAIEIDFASHDDFSFHTHSLLVGEFARRGLIADSPQVMAITAEALQNERSTLSLTHQVRDSGCAIVWSLARTSASPNLLSAIPALVAMALFERDINLRRAAAAGLQELVGRIGTVAYPEGLVLVGEIDFWSVANLTHTFTVIPSRLPHSLRSHLVAQLEELKLFHQNSEIQQLAAAALGILASDAPQLLERLCGLGLSEEPRVRLGAILGVRHVLDQATTITTAQSEIRNLIPSLEKKRLFRGKGGDRIRIAAYQLVSSMCGAFTVGKLDSKNKEKLVLKLLEIVTDGIAHLVDNVSVAAAGAYSSLSQIADPEVMLDSIKKFVHSLTHHADTNIASRRGMIRALSSLGNWVGLESELSALFASECMQWPSHSLSRDLIDPLARRYALKGLVECSFPNPSTIECVLSCLEDFETDKRGDVGSWVREMAVVAAAKFAPHDPRLLVSLVSHAGERLDRVRGVVGEQLCVLAGGAICRTQNMSSPLTTQKMFSSSAILAPFQNASPSSPSFPFAQVCEAYASVGCPQLLCHLVNTVGGLSTQYAVAERELVRLAEYSPTLVDDLIQLFSNHHPLRFQNRTDKLCRLWIPLVNTMGLLVGVPSFQNFHAHKIYTHLCDNMATVGRIGPIAETNRLRSFGKLVAKLLSFKDEFFGFLLTHIFLSNIPTVRHAVAMDLVGVLQEDELVDAVDSADWLSEDGWRGALKILANRFGHQVLHRGPLTTPRRESTDYAAFVNEEHRFR